MNSLPLHIALRYLLSRKSHGAVNVISAISLAAIAVAAAAMVIVLSVFNGFNQLAVSKLGKIDPDYRLVSLSGTAVEGVDSLVAAASRLPGVCLAAPEITAQAFGVAAYSGRQAPLQVKGMTEEALAASGLASAVLDGLDRLPSDSAAIISVGVAMELYLRPQPLLCELSVYEPRRIARVNAANPMAAFHAAEVEVTGVYQVEQEEYDRDMIIVPYAMAERLTGYTDRATSIAIYGDKIDSHALEAFADDHGLQALDRYRQQQHVFRLMAIEKWITFLLLAFILAVASMNLISTLSMLILDKQPNMAILRAMGGTRTLVRRIFSTQGWLIVALGGLAGVAVGALLVLGQQHFGWVKFWGADPTLLSVDAYPVVLRASDLAVTMAAVLVIGVLVTLAIPLLLGPVRRTAR